MNTSTEKIKAEIIENFKPIFGDSIPKEQVDTVKKCIDQYRKKRAIDLYKSWNSMDYVMIQYFKQLVEQDADSKIEAIFYKLLLDNKIDFKFQYKIAPYRVDFLFSNFLVFEIDGPMHLLRQEYDARRTKYIKRMGYEIMRIPVAILTMAPQIVIDEIKHKIKKQVKLKK